MNFDNRIFSYYNEIKELNKGKFPYPRFLALYPTNMCQFNCTFCDYKELNSCKPKQLSKTEWMYILDTFKNIGGEAVGLAGGGEPLMLSTIEDLLEYANKIGLKIGVVTNGLNIDKRRKNRLYNLLLETCTYIRISFEAGSGVVFEAIKGKDCFEKIINNVWDLIDDRPKDLQISYKYTISSSYNLEDIKKAILLANHLKFYSIQFKAVCNVNEELDNSNRDFLKTYINSIDVKDVKVICDLDTYKKESNGCRTCAIQTLIDYYGDVYLCCYYRHRLEDHRIGNIFKTKFEDIWGSYEHYSKLMNVDFNKCNLYDCRYIKYDRIMQDAIRTGYLSFI
uniref:Putative radical SAM superfamily protein n=2 Tax=viral metagenome TaxID=1070528 RepID=A0A6H1ZKN4_9ZZZZ